MSDCCDSIPLPSNKKTNIKCLYPVKPHMNNAADRLQTYRDSQNWPTDRKLASPFQLGAAGFYYLGDRDSVKCWYCNGALQNWERETVHGPNMQMVSFM